MKEEEMRKKNNLNCIENPETADTVEFFSKPKTQNKTQQDN